MNPFIEMNHIKKTIESFTLGPVQLSIEPGTVTALIGDNGSGKSTLMGIMMNLIHPSEGEVIAFGENVQGEEENWKQQIAYLPQTTIGYERFNGKYLKGFISHWYPTWDEALFQQIVDDLHIPLDQPFHRLSQGVQQKLTLALTISRGAPLLLLDEPMTFLDIPSKKYFTNLLTTWLDEDDRRSIVLASHQADDIKRLADYIYILKAGGPIGLFEKDRLTERFGRYWISQLPSSELPGEIERDAYSILSSDAQATENYLQINDINWKERTSLDLEEIIALILEQKDSCSL